MVLAVRLSFDTERYFCYLVKEERSALGPRRASAGAALSLAQFPVMGPSDYLLSVYHHRDCASLVYLISAGGLAICRSAALMG